MEEKRSIIIHAGFPKTGTTSIQNVLYYNRALLKHYDNILIPDVSENLTDIICSLFLENPSSHITHRINQMSFSEISDFNNKYLYMLEREIKRQDWRIAVISAEGISNFSYREMTKFRLWLDQFEVSCRIIYYVRDFVSWTRSVIQQLVKSGEILDNLYKDIPLPNFQKKIEIAMNVFGAENTVIYSYEDANHYQNGIVRQFLNMIGATTAYLSMRGKRKERENASMSHEAILLLDRLNLLRPLFDCNGGIGLRRTGREVDFFQSIAGRPYELPNNVISKIRDITIDESRWLTNNFGYKQEDCKLPVNKSHFDIDYSYSLLSSLSILLSDLMNECQHQVNLRQIGEALRNNDLAMVDNLTSDIQRLVPRNAFHT